MAEPNYNEQNTSYSAYCLVYGIPAFETELVTNRTW